MHITNYAGAKNRGGVTSLLMVCIVNFLFIGSPALSATCSLASSKSGIAHINNTASSLSDSPSTIGRGKIAVVKPIFTATAYSNAFYVFYDRYYYSNEPYITKDLNLLNVTIKNGWGWSEGLYSFLVSNKAKQQGLAFGDTMTLIDDVNVTLGGLFHSNHRRYDVLILGFTEYVTADEYYAYKRFVASGGTMILMDACNFLTEVKYQPQAYPSKSGYLSLLKGHGWEFNGTRAWKSVYHRWPDENRKWVGGNYWKYWRGRHYDCLVANTSHPVSSYLREHYGVRIASNYGAHEENILENMTGTSVIGYWNFVNPSEYPGQPVAAYEHRYFNGSVYHAGIMASDRVAQEEFLQAFLVGAVRLTFVRTQRTGFLSTGIPIEYGYVTVAVIVAAVATVAGYRFSKHKKQRTREPRGEAEEPGRETLMPK